MAAPPGLFVSLFFPGVDQPPQPSRTTKFLATISPKPSITPLINGKSRLIARVDASAARRDFVDEAAKTASVGEVSAGL